MSDLHEKAGLVRAGVNNDGEQEWIGTDRQWRLYEQMEAGEAMYERATFPEDQHGR